jgi:hypothetical protein
MAMSNTIDWTNVEAAAKEMAGNWQNFTCFAWHRARDVEDAEQWAIFYTSGRDAGLLDQSNHEEIVKLLSPLPQIQSAFPRAVSIARSGKASPQQGARNFGKRP